MSLFAPLNIYLKPLCSTPTERLPCVIHHKMGKAENNRNFFAPILTKILSILLLCVSCPTFAATSIPFTVNMSEAVNVTGTPRIAVDVGGVTRYATYTSGTGSSALTFTYTMVAGDVDLDGVTLTSPIDLNGGTMKDLRGNDLSPLTYTLPNTSNVKVNYPSLGMDFIYDADGRYTLNGTVYNDLTSFLSAAGGTFTRNSVGTYYDSAGTLQTASANTPRFDYDPTTHVAKGILIEEGRTNLITNGQGQGASGTSSPTGWVLDQGFGGLNYAATSSLTNSKGYGAFQFSINGTTTGGNRLLINPTNTRATVAANTTYTMTWGVELIGGAYPYGIQTNFLWYDSGGSYLSSTLGTNHASISTYARYTDTTTSPANAASLRIRFDLTGYSTIGTSVNFTMQLSGVQLEQGSFSTSYIPTTTATVTRAADVLTLPTGSWYNSPEGTFLSSVNPGSNTSNETWVSFLQGNLSTDSQFIFREGGNLNAFSITTSGTGGRIAGGVSYTSASKAALAYKESNMGYSVNGNITTATYNMPVGLNSLRIGAFSTGNRYLNGWEKGFKYYPLRVSNTQLQLLTQ